MTARKPRKPAPPKLTVAGWLLGLILARAADTARTAGTPARQREVREHLAAAVEAGEVWPHLVLEIEADQGHTGRVDTRSGVLVATLGGELLGRERLRNLRRSDGSEIDDRATVRDLLAEVRLPRGEVVVPAEWVEAHGAPVEGPEIAGDGPADPAEGDDAGGER